MRKQTDETPPANGEAQKELLKQRLLAWIAKGLKNPRKSAGGIGRALGLSSGVGNKIAAGSRDLAADELDIVAAYLELPLPFATLRAPCPVICEANTGMWSASSAFGDINEPRYMYPSVPSIPGGPFSNLDQFAILVRGSGITKPIADKDFLVICVPWKEARREPREGDMVAVELSRSGLFTAAVMKMRKEGGDWELHCDENDNRAIKLTRDLRQAKGNVDEKVFLKGLVLAGHVPFVTE